MTITIAAYQFRIASIMPEVKIRPELKKLIEELIDAYSSEASAEPSYLKSVVKQYQLLPILIDWDGFFALRSDGRIFVVSTEDDTGVQEESDERLRRVAIFQGAKKYPLLTPLIPNRPWNAVDCHHCEGRGRIDLDGIDPDVIVCYCGGLGWLTEEDVIGEPRAL